MSGLCVYGMEYASLEKSVAEVQRGKDDAYAGIMKHEKDALDIVERVSEDMRTKKVRASSLWHTPLNALAFEYAGFLQETYALYMAGNDAAVKEKLATPDGLIAGGITVLGVLLLVALLRI